MFTFKLPDIGEGIQEGEIVRWIKKEGDPVNEDEPFVEVMTDKATVELTSPKKGRIAKHFLKEGEVAKVGQVIVEIDDNAALPAVEPAPPAKEEKTLFELPKEMAMATKKLQKRDSVKPREEAPRPAPKAEPTSQRSTAAPAVRRLAREKGVDIHQVAGTGPAGRVTREDVEKATRQEAPVPTISGYGEIRYSTDPSREERVPLRGLRRTILKAMERSRRTAAHFTYVAEVDCDKLVALRDSATDIANQKGVKLTYLPFIVKAAVAALKKHPDVNVSYDENTQEIVRKKYWHIGVATATDAGLIVPVVRDADRKGILEIAREVADLSERTRAGKAKPEELSGSTFTITSLGKLGGVMATPILNYPEVAIMGVHEMKQVPVVRNGQLAIGWRMNLSFSFDHRIVDGFNGALFANTLIRYLEEPQILLLETL
ncbi:MAG: dihydrolipoamide acetyltransferase family protein [Thermoplasmatota archaeon]